jgi:hypothetical protein
MRVSQVRSGPLDDAFLNVAVCHRRQTLPLIWARRRKPRIASNNLGTHTVNFSQPAGSANRFRRSAWAESIGVWACRRAQGEGAVRTSGIFAP